MILIPVVFGALAFGISRGIKSQKAIFNSYCLTFDNSRIRREQHNTPTISVLYSDVQEISQSADRSISIKGVSSKDIIFVPKQIEDYEKVEIVLNDIKTITTKNNSSIFTKARKLLPLLSGGSMASIYLVNDKIIVSISAIVLLIVLGYSFYEIRISKNIDNTTKRRVWWLIIVLASLLMVVYNKLTV